MISRRSLFLGGASLLATTALVPSPHVAVRRAIEPLAPWMPSPVSPQFASGFRVGDIVHFDAEAFLRDGTLRVITAEAAADRAMAKRWFRITAVSDHEVQVDLTS